MDLTAALCRRTAERDELKARLEHVLRPHVMSAAQISELVEELPERNALSCTQTWGCVLTTTRAFGK